VHIARAGERASRENNTLHKEKKGCRENRSFFSLLDRRAGHGVADLEHGAIARGVYGSVLRNVRETAIGILQESRSHRFKYCFFFFSFSHSVFLHPAFLDIKQACGTFDHVADVSEFVGGLKEGGKLVFPPVLEYSLTPLNAPDDVEEKDELMVILGSNLALEDAVAQEEKKIPSLRKQHSVKGMFCLVPHP